MKYSVLLGRILFSFIFISTVATHFMNETIQFAAIEGVPLPKVLVPLTGVIAFLGGMSVAMGYKARQGAWLIIMFLIPVTYVMHQFWTIADPLAAKTQYAMFMKNVSMAGAALLIAYFGSGPLSLDNNNRKN